MTHDDQASVPMANEAELRDIFAAPIAAQIVKHLLDGGLDFDQVSRRAPAVARLAFVVADAMVADGGS